MARVDEVADGIYRISTVEPETEFQFNQFLIDTTRSPLGFHMVFEETTQSLFPADLYIQPGDQPPVVREDLGEVMCGFYKEVGIFAAEEPVRRVVDRIERLDPQWVHPMHGGSLPRGDPRLYPRPQERIVHLRGQSVRTIPG